MVIKVQADTEAAIVEQEGMLVAQAVAEVMPETGNEQ
jgi:hypothetical protein